MLVLIGLIVSLIVALIIAKIFNRKFFPVWLCVFITMITVVISFLSIVTIIEFGVTNESILTLFVAILSWISSITVWKGL